MQKPLVHPPTSKNYPARPACIVNPQLQLLNICLRGKYILKLGIVDFYLADNR